MSGSPQEDRVKRKEETIEGYVKEQARRRALKTEVLQNDKGAKIKVCPYCDSCRIRTMTTTHGMQCTKCKKSFPEI